MLKFYPGRNFLLFSIGTLASFALSAQCPAITCPGNMTVNNDAGNCSAVVNYTPPVGTNPCAVTSQTFNYTGSIVTWTVPVGVTSIHIVANGAQGGFNTNSTTQSGLGATMEGDFAVTPGAVLKLLVGEQPSVSAGNGGGGGTFVTDNSNVPMIIAGGGGGSSQGADSPDKHGQVGTSGGTGAAGGGTGGINGNGGNIGASGFQSGAGGGLLTNGADGWTSGTGGFAFVNGGSGGPTNAPARGGFGGGGSGSSYVVGGGGGSYNAGTNQVNTGGVNTGNGTIVITYTNSSAATTTMTSGIGSGGTFPLGTTTETYMVDDGLGNQATCSFTITVNDSELPVIGSMSNISVNNDSGVCGAVVTYTAPVGTDNCSGATTTLIAGLGSGATFPIGSTTETYQVTDGAGNFATTSFTVTVTDNEAPVLNCPANIAVNNDPGICGAVVNYNAPVGTDNCSGSTTVLTAGLGSGATFPVGITTETYTVTDASGNTSSCSFTVSVSDAEAPVITCPANITQNADQGMCSAVVTYNAPVGTDNCSGTTTTLISGIGSGGTFPNGTTVETYQVTDGAGNITTCQFSVTVVDNQAPTFTCPSNVSSCVPNITGIGLGTISDNCATAFGVNYSLSGATTGSGLNDASGTFNPGTTTVWYFVNDGNGNTDSCSFTVLIHPLVPPTVSSTATVVCVDDAAVTLTGTPSNGTWSGTAVTGTTFDPGVAGTGTFAVTYTYTDANGCTPSASLTLSVNACVGVEEGTSLSGVSVYPNPNNGTFSIAINSNVGDVTIELMDLQGRVVYSSFEKNVQAGFVKQLSPDVLASGIYLLKLSTNGQQRLDKISIQK